MGRWYDGWGVNSEGIVAPEGEARRVEATYDDDAKSTHLWTEAAEDLRLKQLVVRFPLGRCLPPNKAV